MPREESKAVPEGNDPVPQDASGLLAEIIMGELRRTISEAAVDKSFDELKENLGTMSETIDRMLRATDQCLTATEHDAWQPRLATEVVKKTDTKIRKRTEDAAADQAKHENSCSAKTVDAPPPMCLTSFGNESTEYPSHTCRDDALVDKGVAAPKPCLLPVKVRTLTAADGLLPTGAASTATRNLFHQPPIWFC